MPCQPRCGFHRPAAWRPGRVRRSCGRCTASRLTIQWRSRPPAAARRRSALVRSNPCETDLTIQPGCSVTPYTWVKKFESFERIKSIVKQTEILTHASHVNTAGSQPVYMNCMCQNFRLFHVSNLSVRNFPNFSAHVYGVIVRYTGHGSNPVFLVIWPFVRQQILVILVIWPFCGGSILARNRAITLYLPL